MQRRRVKQQYLRLIYCFYTFIYDAPARRTPHLADNDIQPFGLPLPSKASETRKSRLSASNQS